MERILRLMRLRGSFAAQICHLQPIVGRKPLRPRPWKRELTPIVSQSADRDGFRRNEAHRALFADLGRVKVRVAIESAIKAPTRTFSLQQRIERYDEKSAARADECPCGTRPGLIRLS